MTTSLLLEYRPTPTINEFHAIDIVQARGAWRSVTWERRLELLRKLAETAKNSHVNLLVQSMNPGASAAEWRQFIIETNKEFSLPDVFTDSLFDLSNKKTLALYATILRVVSFFTKRFPGSLPRNVICFVDEGVRHHHRSIIADSPIFNIFYGNQIAFARSSDFAGLQLADFAAYTLNRHQMILGKSRMSKSEREFFILFSDFVATFDGMVTKGAMLIGDDGEVHDVHGDIELRAGEKTRMNELIRSKTTKRS